MLLLAMAIIAVFGIAVQQALAKSSYQHFTANSCSSCHPGGNTGILPTNATCISCHTGYQTLASGKTCWTCHTPGQAMAAVKTGAPGICTTACHLASGASNTHLAHNQPTSCTTCHPLTASGTDPNGSWHHTLRAPAGTTLTSFAPSSGPVGTVVTITGTGFTGATAVAFNGTPTVVFDPVSATSITGTVPVGATAGTIAVTPLGGPVVTSSTSFTVTTGAVTTTVSLKVAPATVKLKKSVKATGLAAPTVELVGSKVAFKVEMEKSGKWVKVKTGSANVLVTGKYSWPYKPTKRGTYRITATIAASAGHHLGSHSPTKTFKVK